MLSYKIVVATYLLTSNENRANALKRFRGQRFAGSKRIIECKSGSTRIFKKSQQIIQLSMIDTLLAQEVAALQIQNSSSFV